MNADLAVVLLLLGAAIAMFIAGRPRMDVVALIVIVVMPLTGVITAGEALAGFSDPNVVLIAALFVIGEGLVRTGVARRLGDWLDARAGSSETRMIMLLMLAVAGLGAFMSSTAVVAIFIPVVLRISARSGMSPRLLMMPLSTAALLSGMLTLVATAPNLVVNAELVRQGATGFGFFSFTPVGLPLLLLGVGYMLLARRWLASAGRTGPEGAVPARSSLRDWIALYDLPTREHRVRVLGNSPLTGRALGDLPLRAEGVNLLAVERRRTFGTDLIRPTKRTVLGAGDVLLLDLQNPGTEIQSVAARYGLEPLPPGEVGRYFAGHGQEVGMVEAIVPADSPFIGRTVLEARMRSEYGLTAIGLRRAGVSHARDLLEVKLRVGDTLLLFGFWSDIQRLRQADVAADLVLLNLPAEFEEILPAAGRAPLAVLALAVSVGLMISGVVTNVHAALIGCLLMGLFRCVDLDSAYHSISWKSLVLIVGMLPFSLALQRTGGVDLAADGLLAVSGDASPRTVLAILFAVTAALGLFISNTATAVLMAPVALAVAADLGASPHPFAMTVALAASAAFMTPVSSPVNTLVVGPGGYGFGDFVRIGVPFTLVVMAVSLVLVPWLLPLR